MDKYTVTSGTGLAFDNDASWSPINIRSAAFQWTASGSGTDEYYLEASGGGNPNTVLTGLVEPDNVQINGTAATAGTAGSLALLTWDWADNDTLGYSTIYVRLGSRLADPDAQADGYATFTASPAANDNVYFRGSASFLGGDFSSIELDDIILLPGYTGTIGDALNPLKLDMGNADRIEINATGKVYLSLGDAACSPRVNRTGAAANGAAGLYLIDCSALNDLFVDGGTVQLEGSSVDDAYVASGGTLLGDADTACTGDLENNGGTVVWKGTGVDNFTNGGTTTIEGTDAWAVVEVSAGTAIYNSSGTLTAATAVGTGTIDFTKKSVGQTVTTPKVEGEGKIIYNPANTVMSNVSTGDGPRLIKGGTS